MTTVVSYIEEYFSADGRTPLPAECGGKFVQIAGQGEQYLVFAPREMAVYHADIVKRFCDSHDIAGHFNAKRDGFFIDSPGWRIVGGGHWHWQRAMGQLHLFGRSMAYGGLDLCRVRDQLMEAEGFAGMTVIVDRPG